MPSGEIQTFFFFFFPRLLSMIQSRPWQLSGLHAFGNCHSNGPKLIHATQAIKKIVEAALYGSVTASNAKGESSPGS